MSARRISRTFSKLIGLVCAAIFLSFSIPCWEQLSLELPPDRPQRITRGSAAINAITRSLDRAPPLR